jgi:hypothetical protein
VKLPKTGTGNAMPGSSPRSACSTAARATAEWRPSCFPRSTGELPPGDFDRPLGRAKENMKFQIFTEICHSCL